MNLIAQHRSEIYDYFHSNSACQQFFFDPANEDIYAAYYNSMYLLQDSTESLLRHREIRFNADPLLAYLEFWGVMQAVIIQQDSITELYQVIVEETLDAKKMKLDAWLKIRNFRNVCAGHPAKKDRPKELPLCRTFISRNFGDYESITYELWQKGEGTRHPQECLSALLDAYTIEARKKITGVLSQMKNRWK
jgi:hypothetical protein